MPIHHKGRMTPHMSDTVSLVLFLQVGIPSSRPKVLNGFREWFSVIV